MEISIIDIADVPVATGRGKYKTLLNQAKKLKPYHVMSIKHLTQRELDAMRTAFTRKGFPISQRTEPGGLRTLYVFAIGVDNAT